MYAHAARRMVRANPRDYLFFLVDINREFRKKDIIQQLI